MISWIVCFLQTACTSDSQRSKTLYGLPTDAQTQQLPLIGTTTHPSMSKPPAPLYWQLRTGETTAANHQTQGRPYSAQRPTDHECAPLREEHMKRLSLDAFIVMFLRASAMFTCKLKVWAYVNCENNHVS